VSIKRRQDSKLAFVKRAGFVDEIAATGFAHPAIKNDSGAILRSGRATVWRENRQRLNPLEALSLYPLFYPLVKNFRHYLSVHEMMRFSDLPSVEHIRSSRDNVRKSTR
jgi:hypothetical protein